MVTPADVSRSAIAWKRRKSLSAESFTFGILNTQYLKLVMNKGRPSWQIKHDIHETESFANTRFHKIFKPAVTSIMPKMFLGPSGTNRQRTEIPHWITFCQMPRYKRLALSYMEGHTDEILNTLYVLQISSRFKQINPNSGQIFCSW